MLRLHVTSELTDRTILTCPPAEPPAPFEEVVPVPGVRSIDLHRYLARVNLVSDADRGEVASAVTALMRGAWGDPAPLLIEELPRTFEAPTAGPRRVAESGEMAGDDPLLSALFHVEGVTEAIVGEGVVLVRLGRLFRWEDVEGRVRAAIA